MLLVPNNYKMPAFARNQVPEILNISHLLDHRLRCWRFVLNRGRRRKAMTDLAGDGEDAASCSVPGGGDAEMSPETGTARLAATSPVEVRSKNLGWRVWDLRMGSTPLAAGVGEDRWSVVVAGVEEDHRSCGGRGWIR
jgi:hypothetical protein